MTLAQQVQPVRESELRPRIKVIGVGGAGGNAINNMIRSKLEGVEFYVCNTDAQHLEQSLTDEDKRIQLGLGVTQGLGAGSRPEVGRAAAEESMDEILRHFNGANMVFITAGMGGGTGTGAAPVLAQAAREQGILTVGVVTKPFLFEGELRMRSAEHGIEELQKYVDTLIVIPNQNLFRVANEKTTFADAFKMADDVLYSGVRGVTDLMMMPGLINLDFADIRAVMTEMGKAMMGTGEAEGEGRAIAAAEDAISNPLLDDVSMRGAQGVLINITGGMDMTLFEVDEAANRIREEIDPELSRNTNIIFGSTFDEKLNGKIRVSVVATGIDQNRQRQQQPQNDLKPAVRQAAAPQRPVIKAMPQRRDLGQQVGNARAHHTQASEVSSEAEQQSNDDEHARPSAEGNVGQTHQQSQNGVRSDMSSARNETSSLVNTDELRGAYDEERQQHPVQSAPQQTASSEAQQSTAPQQSQNVTREAPQTVSLETDDTSLYPFERDEEDYSEQMPYDFSRDLKQHSRSVNTNWNDSSGFEDFGQKSGSQSFEDRFSGNQESGQSKGMVGLSANEPASVYSAKKNKKDKKKSRRGLIGRFVDSVRGRSDDDYTESSLSSPAGGFLSEPPRGWNKNVAQGEQDYDPLAGYSSISSDSRSSQSSNSNQSHYYDKMSEGSAQQQGASQGDRFDGGDVRFSGQGDDRFGSSFAQDERFGKSQQSQDRDYMSQAYQEEPLEDDSGRAQSHEDLRMYSNPNEKAATSAAYESDVQDVPAFVRRKQKN